MAGDEIVRALEALVIHGGTMTSRALQAHPETSGLSVTQYRLFVHVVTGDGLRVGELARRIGARPQTTTRLVQRLEARGLIATKRGSEDRRLVLVRATPTGHDLWADIGVRRRREIREAIGDLELSAEDVALLDALVERFSRAVS
jgi:DNA-binding MarR family transcriptional regulator